MLIYEQSFLDLLHLNSIYTRLNVILKCSIVDMYINYITNHKPLGGGGV